MKTQLGRDTGREGRKSGRHELREGLEDNGKAPDAGDQGQGLEGEVTGGSRENRGLGGLNPSW